VTPIMQDDSELPVEQVETELFSNIETELRQDLEMASESITVDVDLTPEDARALRQKVHQMLFAFITWERKAEILSDLVMVALGNGDGDRVVEGDSLRQESDPGGE
jgi:hypothetical protein